MEMTVSLKMGIVAGRHLIIGTGETRLRQLENMILNYSINTTETGLFTIYDVSGRLVKQQEFMPDNHSLIINEGELNAGAYYYKVTVGDTKVKGDKLIIIK